MDSERLVLGYPVTFPPGALDLFQLAGNEEEKQALIGDVSQLSDVDLGQCIASTPGGTDVPHFC